MDFSNKMARAKHETIMHPGFLEKAAERIIDRVLKSNTSETLKARVVLNNRFSYEEIQKMDHATPEYQAVIKVLAHFVEAWLDNNPEYDVTDFFRMNNFQIR